jgi:hypothetical protein
MAELERLERRLVELGGSVDWPPAPDLRAGVRAGLARRRRRRRTAVLLLAAALGIALLTGAASIAYLELRGATVQQVPRLPSPSPRPPGPLGTSLELGQRYGTVAEAERAAGFAAVVPAALGQPDEVYVRSGPDVITLVYRPRPDLPATAEPGVGALVMEARATVDSQSFGKLLSPDTHVQPVTVNGGQGFWITGAPHGFFFYLGVGSDQFRLTGDVLIWNQGGLVIRIESGLDERGAMTIAGTTR